MSFTLNELSVVAAPLKLLQGFPQQIETVDVSLDQMQPGSDFLREMAQAKDPQIPYTLVMENTSLMHEDATATLKQKLLRRLGKVVEIPFFHQPNDIAVLVESITAILAGRSPAPKQLPTACNHLEYFIHPAGLASLSAAVLGTGIQANLDGHTHNRTLELSDAKADNEAPAKVSSSREVKPWLIGLGLTALVGLGLLAKSQFTNTATTPSVESKP